MSDEWVMVPRDPTEAMFSASSFQEWDTFEHEWRAMLDAAPVPTAADCTSVCDAYAAENQQFSDELTRLRARLEVRDDGGPDGITCRDESIRMQDAEIARLRAENERLRGALDNILARTHDGSSYRMAQDIYQTAIDALVPTAPPAR